MILANFEVCNQIHVDGGLGDWCGVSGTSENRPPRPERSVNRRVDYIILGITAIFFLVLFLTVTHTLRLPH